MSVNFTNPFDILAWLLMTMRQALEAQGEQSLPRWVRIARARNHSDTTIGTITIAMVNGLTEGLSRLTGLSIKLKDIFEQTDSIKAVGEVGLELIKEASKEEFINGIAQLISGPGSQGQPDPLIPNFKTLIQAGSSVSSVVDKVEYWLQFVPSPEDLNRIGHELYQLLHFDIKELSNYNATTIDHVNESTGKFRFLQWAFNSEIGIYGGNIENAIKIKKLGSRRITLTGTPIKPTQSKYSYGTDQNVEIFSLTYPNEEDIIEAFTNTQSILKTLGYSNTDIVRALKEFQFTNKLPITGELDNFTLNRLINLDYAGKNIVKALKRGSDSDYHDLNIVSNGYLEIINHGADNYADNGAVLSSTTLQYYIIPETVPEKGWMTYRKEGELIIPNFVAAESRNCRSLPENSNNRMYCEGEAAFGRFFFGAYMSEPWIAGRWGSTLNSIYCNDPQSKPQISKMYQWIDITNIVNGIPAGFNLCLTGSVLQRSLYREPIADAGQMSLTIYQTTEIQKNTKLTENLPGKGSSVQSGFWPDRNMQRVFLTAEERLMRNCWVLCKTPELSIEKVTGTFWLLITLEGQHNAGYDIDAYFDEVRVYWEYKKIAG